MTSVYKWAESNVTDIRIFTGQNSNKTAFYTHSGRGSPIYGGANVFKHRENSFKNVGCVERTYWDKLCQNAIMGVCEVNQYFCKFSTSTVRAIRRVAGIKRSWSLAALSNYFIGSMLGCLQ